MSYKEADGREGYKQCYLLTMDDFKTYNIKKIATGQGDDYATGCLLDYPYSKQYYKLIAINLSKHKN